jgi:glycosyltransferase involved in cell wall biosynthesis
LGPLSGAARGFTRWLKGERFLRSVVEIAEGQFGESTVCHFLDYEYISLARALRRLAPRCKTVVTMHPSDFRPGGFGTAAVYKRYVRRLLEDAQADAYFCHGSWIAERLSAQFSFRRDAIIHGFPYPALQAVPMPTRTDARRALGLDRRVDKWLLWYGMIRRNKRIDRAFEILAALPEHYGLIVAGNPTEVSRGEVLQMAAARGLQHRTHLALRYIEDEEVPRFFGAADLLLATHDAGFTSASGPVSDARSYGLPAVVPGIGELANYVEGYGVGRTAEPDNAAAFAATIRAIVEDRYARWRIERRIKQVARELSWSAFAAEHASLYERLLAATTIPTAVAGTDRDAPVAEALMMAHPTADKKAA